jgi:hypothetical protein
MGAPGLDFETWDSKNPTRLSLIPPETLEITTKAKSEFLVTTGIPREWCAIQWMR